MRKVYSGLLALVVAGTLVGCTGKPAQSPEVSDNIPKSLD
jgi:hypothetical protein